MDVVLQTIAGLVCVALITAPAYVVYTRPDRFRRLAVAYGWIFGPIAAIWLIFSLGYDVGATAQISASSKELLAHTPPVLASLTDRVSTPGIGGVWLPVAVIAAFVYMGVLDWLAGHWRD